MFFSPGANSSMYDLELKTQQVVSVTSIYTGGTTVILILDLKKVAIFSVST
jgi:hypothetical protein